MTDVERWGVHEVVLDGPAGGNPFVEVELGGFFQFRNRVVEVDGFYDGAGSYKVRFMPDRVGEWRYVTRSNVPELDGVRGEFTCGPPAPGNHGPVRVVDSYRFAYADGTPHLPFGTTCYHWTHTMDEEREESTLRALAGSPFTKVRMCLLPTRGMAPPHLAFEGTTPGSVDTTRFEPAYFAHLERRIADLARIGVEADLILFHPYDKGFWGFDAMTPEQDRFLLRYVVARLAAFRNVWWSLANEYDFNANKTVDDWDALLRFVQRADPYQHLRSIHNGTRMYEWAAVYDASKPWLTHQSVQHWDAACVAELRERWGKPVIVDEMSYEGDIDRRWGNVTGEDLVQRIWRGAVGGGYVGHGECFVDSDLGRWVGAGGRLQGDSPSRIAFLRGLLEDAGPDWFDAMRRGTYRLEYVGDRQPAHHELDLPDADHRVDLVDTWAMTVTPLEGEFRGRCRIPLGRRRHLALRIRRV